MPVTKTAKRALRSSKKKREANVIYLAKLEIALRAAKKSKSSEKINAAISLADRAAKKHMVHPNKAARIKSTLSKLLPKTRLDKKSPPSKKSSKK